MCYIEVPAGTHSHSWFQGEFVRSYISGYDLMGQPLYTNIYRWRCTSCDATRESESQPT
jgi:hypothetical protein